MLVILKENVRGLGQKYEIKDVAQGYASNFLIPRRLAEHASAETVKKYETLKLQQKTEIEIKEKLTQKQIEMLEGAKIVLSKKSNDQGHLFEQIHAAEIAEALKKQVKIEINPDFIILENPIKEIGEHRVSAQIGKTLATFLVTIEPSK